MNITTMHRFARYALPVLLGFLGGLASNHFGPDAEAQSDDQPDQTEVHDLLRTRKLEVVTEDGRALLMLVASSDEHSKHAAISLGVHERSHEDGMPRNDYGRALLTYNWTDGTQGPVKTDGTGERAKTPPRAWTRLQMSSNELGGSSAGLSPGGLSILTGTLGDKPKNDMRAVRLEPDKLDMDRNGLTNVYLGYGSGSPQPRLGLRAGNLAIEAWVPRDSKDLPRIEIRDADDKTVASLPGEEE